MTGIDLTTWARGPMDELSVEGRIDQVARAQAVAVVAHEGQIDKLGVAYIGHPAAVAARFDPKEQTLEHCAAWLHDVIEDTSVDANLLARAGIHDDVIEVVKLLTRGPDDGDDYYRRIAAHPRRASGEAVRHPPQHRPPRPHAPARRRVPRAARREVPARAAPARELT